MNNHINIYILENDGFSEERGIVYFGESFPVVNNFISLFIEGDSNSIFSKLYDKSTFFYEEFVNMCRNDKNHLIEFLDSVDISYSLKRFNQAHHSYSLGIPTDESP